MDQNTADKQMYQGDWSCSSCGKDIKELPFEPKETGNLLCRDCFSEKRNTQNNKQMYQGDWSCSSCGGSIKELPFEPKETGNLLCRECFKKSKQ